MYRPRCFASPPHLWLELSSHTLPDPPPNISPLSLRMVSCAGPVSFLYLCESQCFLPSAIFLRTPLPPPSSLRQDGPILGRRQTSTTEPPVMDLHCHYCKTPSRASLRCPSLIELSSPDHSSTFVALHLSGSRVSSTVQRFQASSSDCDKTLCDSLCGRRQ